MVSGSTLAIDIRLDGMEGGGRPRVCCRPVASLNLSPGEQVIFQGHPSWRAILGFYLKGILVAAILGVIAQALRRRQRAPSSSSSSS